MDTVWNPEYNKKVKDAIQDYFIETIDAQDFIIYAKNPTTREPVFTDMEKDKIRTRYQTQSQRDGAVLLLDLLARKDNWFCILTETLSHKELRSQHVAKHMKKLKDDIDAAIGRSTSVWGYPSESTLRTIMAEWDKFQQIIVRQKEEFVDMKSEMSNIHERVDTLGADLTQTQTTVRAIKEEVLPATRNELSNIDSRVVHVQQAVTTLENFVEKADIHRSENENRLQTMETETKQFRADMKERQNGCDKEQRLLHDKIDTLSQKDSDMEQKMESSDDKISALGKSIETTTESVVALDKQVSTNTKDIESIQHLSISIKEEVNQLSVERISTERHLRDQNQTTKDLVKQVAGAFDLNKELLKRIGDIETTINRECICSVVVVEPPVGPSTSDCVLKTGKLISNNGAGWDVAGGWFVAPNGGKHLVITWALHAVDAKGKVKFGVKRLSDKGEASEAWVALAVTKGSADSANASCVLDLATGDKVGVGMKAIDGGRLQTCVLYIIRIGR